MPRFSGEAEASLFYQLLSPGELRALAGRMEGRRFDPSLVLETGPRCRFGGVRVLVCAPVAGLRPLMKSKKALLREWAIFPSMI